MKHIICIYHTPHNSHCQKRLKQFISQGYSVELHCFSREGKAGNLSGEYPIHIMGDLSNQNYAHRLGCYIKSIWKIIRATPRRSMYYIYGLDIAIVFNILAFRRSFLYEEADMMHKEKGMSNSFISWGLEQIDKLIIRKAKLTIFTSEGFLEYHFGAKKIKNYCVLPNLLEPDISQFIPTKNSVDIHHLRFAFVGLMRYNTVYNFALTIGKMFSQHSFHFYGPMNPEFEPLKAYPNIYFHGAYSNPNDLPAIYESIDILICTYDASAINVQYAEPNKLYEAIYFNTPIIVSSNTFLARKVQQLNIGYNINAHEIQLIKTFIQCLSPDSIHSKQMACQNIDKSLTIYNNKLFEPINTALSNTI